MESSVWATGTPASDGTPVTAWPTQPVRIPHLQEGLEHPVAPQLHGLEVDSKQAVDELRVGAPVGAHTHGALEHPCCTQARVVRVDGCQCFLIHSLSLQANQCTLHHCFHFCAAAPLASLNSCRILSMVSPVFSYALSWLIHFSVDVTDVIICT